ncbi:MAG: tetratricopeptide repeat protein [Pyrinomonadaceae bacterium]
MKRCPECGREYDNSMMFCLDDGAKLLYGPARSDPGAGATGFPSDEPQTAILHSTAAPGEAPTRAQIHTTEQTAILPRGSEAEPRESLGGLSEKQSLSAHRTAKPLIAAVVAVAVLVGGFFGYKYLSPSKQIQSIAVMPFVNESGNADVEYLSDGMTETLIKSLSELPNLNVKPRSSVFRYKGKDTDLKTIGKELNVEAILNGRVIQRGEQLTLSLELVDVQNDKVLWTEQYQRKQSDLVTLQSEIARDVSTKLKLRLSGADEAKVTKSATVHPEAYQAYLKGRYYWNRRTGENLKKAIEQFKAATDRDPNYALAYVGLADCYILLNQYAGTPLSETVPQAKVYAERSIAIGEQLAEPHTSLGVIYEQSWQWAEAEREFKRAIELNPNYATAFHWYSTFRRNTGRTNEAAPLITRAHEIDPLSSAISGDVAAIYLIQNNHQAAIETCLKVIELDPTFSNAYQYLALAYLKQGRNNEAISNLEKAVELSSRAGETLRYLGYAYSVTGKRSQANAILKELEEKYVRKEANGRDVAGVYAGLGDEDKAFEWLEKDFQSREELAPIRWQIPFEPLRDDPRYKDLLKRMNLPE